MSNAQQFKLAQYLGECCDIEEKPQSMFFEVMTGTAVKASGTDSQPNAVGNVLYGVWSFHNK